MAHKPPKPQNGALSFSRPEQLILHDIEGAIISQRPIDGYINATELCKKAGKQFKHYNENQSTKDYLIALSAEVGIPTSALIQILKGGNDHKSQGTWVHPQVATHLGQWLSSKFAVQVNKWVVDWIKGDVRAFMPPHVKRYILRDLYTCCPAGRFRH